jgi:ribosomal protein S18 acetylase RimI-like enzyme
MAAMLKSYDGDRDFMRIRNFLVETFSQYQRPFNWLIDRWNFVRYFGIPYHTFYNTSYMGVPAYPRRSHRDELPVWERTIGLWEDEGGSIVGVVHTENEEPGEAWIQIHPAHTDLYGEMVTYIEERLADRVEDIGYVKLYINDGSELEQIARARGYRKLKGTQIFREYIINEPTAPRLSDGFVIRSVADVDDIEKRRLVRALSFGPYYGPSEWPPASVFSEMQRAPDYRKDLDLFIVAPNGEYVSFCTIWIDEQNRYGNFEPVGTHAEYQGLGLGRALLMEGFRRMAGYGIERSFMESDNAFYRKVGFKETPYSYSPWIRYFKV